MTRHSSMVGLFCLLLANTLSADDLSSVADRLDTAVSAATHKPLAPQVDDAGFLRRVSIDLTGHVPPVLQANEFLADPDPAKRSKLVDQLLASPDFAQHWGKLLAEWAVAERPIKRDNYNGLVLQEFLAEGIQAKTPYNELVRDLIMGSGASDSSGPANFLLRYEAEPLRLAGGLGKNLLGITIQCAQCHDHPTASWKQDDFWALAANFARVRKLNADNDLEGMRGILEAKRGELTKETPKKAEDQDEGEPMRRVVVKPRLLDGKHVDSNKRRQALGDWLVAGDNPFVARNLVNKVWSQLFGQGLVKNLDHLDKPSPATEVLDMLTAEFVSNGYELQHLLRVVMLSKSYEQTAIEEAQPRWARPMTRPLSVDQLFESVARSTGYEGPLPGVPEMQDEEDEEPEPADAEAEVEAFEDGDKPVEQLGERALTLQRALVLANGEFIREASKSGANLVRVLTRDPDVQLEFACVATLSRKPTASEQAILKPLLQTKDKRQGLEDLFWVLFNSAEFQTNH